MTMMIPRDPNFDKEGFYIKRKRQSLRLRPLPGILCSEGKAQVHEAQLQAVSLGLQRSQYTIGRALPNSSTCTKVSKQSISPRVLCASLAQQRQGLLPLQGILQEKRCSPSILRSLEAQLQ